MLASRIITTRILQFISEKDKEAFGTTSTDGHARKEIDRRRKWKEERKITNTPGNSLLRQHIRLTRQRNEQEGTERERNRAGGDDKNHEDWRTSTSGATNTIITNTDTNPTNKTSATHANDRRSPRPKKRPKSRAMATKPNENAGGCNKHTNTGNDVRRNTAGCDASERDTGPDGGRHGRGPAEATGHLTKLARELESADYLLQGWTKHRPRLGRNNADSSSDLE